MKKIYTILIGLLPVQLIGLIFIKNHPSLIETYYSQKFYPLLFDFYRFFFEKIPFSIGDFFYAIFIMYISYEIVLAFKKKNIKWIDTLKKTLSIFSIIFLAFNLNWGLNYHRIPLHKKLNYNVKYDLSQLEKTFEILVTASNNLHKKLSNADTVPVRISYSKDFIVQKIEEDSHRCYNNKDV